MWRSLFCALGISLIIVGAECLVVDKAVVAYPKKADASAPGEPQSTIERREFAPPEWAPWSLMASGAVVMLYSFTLARGG